MRGVGHWTDTAGQPCPVGLLCVGKRRERKLRLDPQGQDWGPQGSEPGFFGVKSRVSLGKGHCYWALRDEQDFSGWGSQLPTPYLSFSIRALSWKILGEMQRLEAGP